MYFFSLLFVSAVINAKKGMVINMSYEVKKTDGRARRGTMNTVHGVIETPVFMNVGTAAAMLEQARLLRAEYRPLICRK